MHHTELRSRRRKLGLTQAELAAHLEVAPNTVARWERGELTIARPGILRILLDAIDHELLQDPAWREEHNRRMRAQMEHALATADDEAE